MDIKSFAQKTLELLRIEQAADEEQAAISRSKFSLKELENDGVAIRKLTIESIGIGLGERINATLERVFKNPLPANKFTPGDVAEIVQPLPEGGFDAICRGVVASVSDNSIILSANESDSNLSSGMKDIALVKMANEVTYQKCRNILKDLHQLSDHCSKIVDVCFGGCEPCFSELPSLSNDQVKVLNEEQSLAVQRSLASQDMFLIHGPPGTGKTTTVSACIDAAVRKGLRVLCCAPSNVAIDNLCEKLIEKRLRVVRVGHPARMLPNVVENSLDMAIQRTESSALLQDIRREMSVALKEIQKAPKSSRRQLYTELKELRKEKRIRERKSVREALSRAQVVCSTLIGAADRNIAEQAPFDLVVIDEACQGLECWCWLALQHGTRCLLAGDHLQLPPTVVSMEAAKQGLEVTLFDRIHKKHKEKISTMLTTQYRMNEHIMRVPSDCLYDGKLTAHNSVAFHTLDQLINSHRQGCSRVDEMSPLCLIDTSGCGFYEMQSRIGSKANPSEAAICLSVVRNLVEDCGLAQESVGIIAPYNAQVSLLRLAVKPQFPAVEISTVDGFQGREKECIIVTCTRSNSSQEIGFLSDVRRNNVAFTRARRRIVCIVDAETVKGDSFLNKYVNYASDTGEHLSGEQFTVEDLSNIVDELGLEGVSHDASSSGTQPVDTNMLAAQKPSSSQSKSTAGKPHLSKAQRNAMKRQQQQPRQNNSDNVGVRYSTPGENIQSSDSIAALDEAMSKATMLVSDFMKSDKQSQTFNSLNGLERKAVHQFCDEIGADTISHISEQGQHGRVLVLQKIRDQSSAPDVPLQHRSDAGQQAQHSVSTDSEPTHSVLEDSTSALDAAEQIIQDFIVNGKPRQEIMDIDPEVQSLVLEIANCSEGIQARVTGLGQYRTLTLKNISEQKAIIRRPNPVAEKVEPSNKPVSKKKQAKKKACSQLKADAEDFDALLEEYTAATSKPGGVRQTVARAAVNPWEKDHQNRLHASLTSKINASKSARAAHVKGKKKK